MFTHHQHVDRDEAVKSLQDLLDDVDSTTPLPLDFKELDRSHKNSVVQQKIDDASYAQVRSGVLDAEVNEETLAQLAWAIVWGGMEPGVTSHSAEAGLHKTKDWTISATCGTLSG